MTDTRQFGPDPGLAGSWDATLLGHLAEINLRFLELVARAAKGSAATLRTPVVSLLRSEWRQLTPQRLAQLAECPYLLLDVGFATPACWSGLAPAAVHEDAAPGGYRFAEAIGADLIRRVLVFAWHLARANPLAARVILGMSDECTALIAARRLPELERVAEARPEWIRPRWEDKPEVWRQLLLAASTGQQLRLRQFQLRGLQLLARGLAGNPP
jgi:hypothetical protein